MALSIRTDITAMSASFDLNRTQRAMRNNLHRVSTGLRVAKAADDSAGLAVATNLTTSARSTRQAIRNSNDGISIIQTAESASNEVKDILQRMRELAVQASSETVRDDERSYIQDEYDELSDEVARIASETEFSGIQLTDGTLTQLTVQVGINNNTSSRINFELGELTTTILGLGTAITLTSTTGAQTAIDTLDTALDSINGYRAEFGAVQNRLESSINNSQAFQQALTGAASTIQDADYAEETSDMTRNQIMLQAGTAALVQARMINASVLALL
jgi:flagellin